MSQSIEQILDMLASFHSDSHGCEWTKSQSFASLAPMTLEEVYELVEAIEQEDVNSIKSELGDLLYHVLLYCFIAQSQALFTLDEVVSHNLEKHQHRMPDAKARQQLSAEQVNAHWQANKAKLRTQQKSVLEGVSTALPALTRAGKLQARAAQVGFDWPQAQAVIKKVHEEIKELEHEIENGPHEKIEDEFGDVLFACVNLARHLNIDPETALRKANRKFTRRFNVLEDNAKQQKLNLNELSIDELESLWQDAKSVLNNS